MRIADAYAVEDPQRAETREKVGAYFALTKPRIIELLLVTTVPTMVVAERGMPSGWLILATLVGGTLAAGGANALPDTHTHPVDLPPLLRQLRISCAVRRQIAEFSDQRAKRQGRLVVPEARCITHSLV